MGNNIITITRWLTYLRYVSPGIWIWQYLIRCTGENISSNCRKLCSIYSKCQQLVLYKWCKVWPSMYCDNAWYKPAICEWSWGIGWYGTVPNCPRFKGVASWRLADGDVNCITGWFFWPISTMSSSKNFLHKHFLFFPDFRCLHSVHWCNLCGWNKIHKRHTPAHKCRQVGTFKTHYIFHCNV